MSDEPELRDVFVKKMNHISKQKSIKVPDFLKRYGSKKKLSSFFDKVKPSTLKSNPFKDFDKALAEATFDYKTLKKI